MATAGGLVPRTLASSTVVDRDGRRVGRVLDVYLADRSGDVAAVSVALAPLGTREALVPARLLTTTGGARVRVDAPRRAVREGPTPPATAHLEPADLAALDRAYGQAGGEEGA